MSPGWRTQPLGEIATFERGLTYSKGDEVAYSSNGVLRANNIDLVTKSLDLTEIRYISDAFQVPSSKKVKDGSLLICTASGSRSHLGKVALIDGDYDLAFGGFMGLISAGQAVESRFLYYALTSRAYQEKLDSLAGGTNINNLKFKDIADFPIPLPPLEEQRRIVAVLDEAFAAIATATANAEKNLANARELFERYLAETFSRSEEDWIEEPLNAHVRFVDYRGKTPPKRDAGIRLITAKNVKMGFVQRHPEEFVDPDAYDNWMTRGLPNPGDVLFTTEAPLGNVAQLDTNEKVMIGQRLITMQPDPNRLYSSFLKYALCSAPVQKLIHQKATGATVAGIKAKLLKLIPIRYPSLAEQSQIVGKLDEIYSYSQDLAERAKAKLDALAALRQCLLHRAFSGELTSKKAATLVALNDNFATPEFAAKIVAFAYERHVAKNRVRNFGTVKAEKILHMVEAIGGIDLGRQPSREAAGPDDATHRHATWDWARSQHFFRFNRRSGGGYDFEKLSSYSRMIEDATAAIAGTAVEKAIELLVDMDRDFAELIATTYAAWNNLIIDQCAATDDDIVLAARDKWHHDKLRFDPSRFHDAIRFIRSNSIVPDGTAKRVGGQEALLF